MRERGSEVSLHDRSSLPKMTPIDSQLSTIGVQMSAAEAFQRSRPIKTWDSLAQELRQLQKKPQIHTHTLSHTHTSTWKQVKPEMKMNPQQIFTWPLNLNIPFYSNVVALISAQKKSRIARAASFGSAVAIKVNKQGLIVFLIFKKRQKRDLM